MSIKPGFASLKVGDQTKSWCFSSKRSPAAPAFGLGGSEVGGGSNDPSKAELMGAHPPHELLHLSQSLEN